MLLSDKNGEFGMLNENTGDHMLSNLSMYQCIKT
jgi:hypothetical protein